MSEDIILTKIAKRANNSLQFDKSINTTFEYDDKSWVLLDVFKDNAKIMHAVNYRWPSRIKDFVFTPSDDETHLMFVYRPFLVRNQNYFEKVIEELLGVIYENYKPNNKNATSRETTVLKTYVTTKLFDALQKQHTAAKEITPEMLNALALPAKFLPTLCEYQKQTVLWLLYKEQNSVTFPDFFKRLISKDNESIIYKHLYYRYIQTDQPPDICLPPGGILADEMGLGKTVEMLALILLNRRTDVEQNDELCDFWKALTTKCQRKSLRVFCICTSNSKKDIVQCNKCLLWQHAKCVRHNDDYLDYEKPYLCPSCWQIATDECGLFKTKATFIVTPNTIKLQWLSEIQRHTNPPLRVFLYDGTFSDKWISPWELAEYDVVLTDYNAFRGDIYYTKENTTKRSLRNKPRSMRKHTPILMMEWWRVLLDEAQMVESNNSKVALLVRMIPAINRWAVTGTPIQKSLNDLQGLLQFIGFEAVSDTLAWKNLASDFLIQQEQLNSNDNKPVPELIKVLQKCMWRTCKTQISSELKIPPQLEIIHRIEFNNLEKLFYNEQHAECYSKFRLNVQKYTEKISTISPQIMRIILQPFLKIRQSCSIPVIVSYTPNNDNINSTHPNKQFLQPKEFHEYLKSTNEIACKSGLRAMASAHNGLAALYFIEKHYEQALKHYESVLKLAKDYKYMNITVDSLLQIHALHNIMQLKIIQNPQTTDLRLETYETQYNALEWKYLETYANSLATEKNSYEAAVKKIDQQIAEDFLIPMSNGFKNLTTNDETALLQKIQEECMPRFNNLKLGEIRSTRSILYVVHLWFEKLTKLLNGLYREIDDLNFFNENVRSRHQVSPAIWREIMDLVNTVYDCHLSEIREVKNTNNKTKPPEKKNKKVLCKLCYIRNSMNQFECLLFDKVIDKDSNDTEGLENPSFEMFLCKLTFSFIKNKQRDMSDVLEQCWSYLESLQLVCKRLIKLWIEMEYTIKAYDELNMCKMRITLTEDPKEKSIFNVMENEIAGRILQQQNELMTSQREFTVKLARLRYITHLEGNEDLGACPICQLEEDDRYAVLECGHHICYPCLKSIRQYDVTSKLHIKCSICRHVQQSQKIYYVSRTKMKTNDNDKIKGDFSSKITCIVRLILKLINKRQDDLSETSSDVEMENNVHSDVKILIFSEWEPILWNISLALKENDIKYRAKCTAKTIEEFKNPNLGISCLLMPFIRGSKGLNLVEATHVFLVEPILNPGEELQAIGRVHRFGQTRPTTVHRFIVNESIEENIYNFIVSSPSNSNNSKETQRRWEFDNISLMDFENLFSLKQKTDCD